MTASLPLFVSKMEKAGLDPALIETFSHYYRLVVTGETGMLSDRDIQPVAPEEIEHADDLVAFAKDGRLAAPKTVVIILNGGLGTSMGLSKAKSLLPVKDGRSFLEIKLRQVERTGAQLAFMNSFATHADTMAAILKLAPSIEPKYFIQNKYPKILRSDYRPARWPKDPQLEWNPPGHGDIYTALFTSGLLNSFLENDISYAFISNSDNLGATLDLSLLGYFASRQLPFMMEVAERTPADLKGGHLARHKNGRFVLRELAQCPRGEIAAFRDLHIYRYFNTNNIWINLRELKAFVQSRGLLHLPMILNPKTIDPRDKTSPHVYQIETAMGAAIALFQGAAVVRVAENRFHPVKKCNELLAIRSDCYRLTPEYHLEMNPMRTAPPSIQLDPRYYGHIDGLDNRFSKGIPSLIACDSLVVEGDVYFEEDVTIQGAVTIRNTKPEPRIVARGSTIGHSIAR